MADVLSLLREYHLNNKPIIENRDEIIFGEFAWPKTTKTNYIIWGTGKDGTAKDYYTLDCIVYLLKNIELPHSQRELLAYLKGETNLAPNIDRTVPIDISVRRPVSKSSGDLQAIRRGEHIDKDAKIEAKRPRMSSYEPTDLSATASLGTGEGGQTEKSDESKMDSSSVQGSTFQAKGSALPKAMPLDKIQSLRAKFRAKQQQTSKPDAADEDLAGVNGAPDSLFTPGGFFSTSDGLPASAAAVGVKGPSYNGPNSQNIILVDDQLPSHPLGGDSSSGRGTFLAADLEVVRVISSRERRWRTRTTTLQSQGKTFYENIVLGILRNVMLKENAHLAPDRTGQGRDLSAYAQVPLAVGSVYSKAPASVNAYGGALVNGGMSANAPSGAQQMQYSRYDQERFAAGRDETAGFRIDTMGTYHGKGLASMVGGGGGLTAPDATPAGAGSAAYGGGVATTPRPPTTPLLSAYDPGRPETPANYNTQTPRDPRGLATPLAGMTPDPYRSARVADTRLLARPKPRASRVPIIIIPAAPTSLITMLNAQDILQDLRFVTTEDKRSQGCKRENELLIHRQKADGRTVPYRVIDQPNKLQPEEWNRVVAVFVQGQAWQFKGWPIGSDPAVIFSLLKGFHLKYANMPLDANVAKWNVQVINLDRRRHLDKVHFQGVWDQLDKHIAKYKSFLRS
ncbi:accessory factor associated with RNA polymerase II [Sparganum proliferum]